IFYGKSPHHSGKRGTPDEESNDQSQRDPDAGNPQCLPVDELFYLPPAHADSAVEPVSSNVLHDCDVEDIIDQKVSTEDEQDDKDRTHGENGRVKRLVRHLIDDTGKIVAGSHILRLSSHAAGPVCHVLLKIDRAGGDDIGP